MQTREAAIAIQGGGVYGLSLLGQLDSVFDHGYQPIALAGTSAGAIVAVLTWAGFTPVEINEKIAALARNEHNKRLTFLLGPEKNNFDFDSFCSLKLEIEGLIGQARDMSGLGIIEKYFLAKRIEKLFSEKLPRHYEGRGFFSGDELEIQIDKWIKEKIIYHKAIPDNDPLLFSHVSEMIERDPVANYRPPLLLTATNLSRKRIELISSFDERYQNLSISKAVRASAGFPVFFSPVDMRGGPDGGGWYVDGGVVSNFPMWAFSDAFRVGIRRSKLSYIYGNISDRPWIRVGLRVVDDVQQTPDLSDPLVFLQSLVGMLTGGTRNELERILTENAARSILIEQPYSKTSGPKNVLDVGALDEVRVAAMVEKGKEYADSILNGLSNPGLLRQDPNLRKLIEDELKGLVERCKCVFSDQAEGLKFRANIFMPMLDDDDVLRMKLIYQVNMNGDPDEAMSFSNVRAGLTGYCYSTRRPQICNLKEIAKVRSQAKDCDDLFGMTHVDQKAVREDRSWLVSMPIFDPCEMRFDKSRTSVGSPIPPSRAVEHYNIKTEIDGPVVGVLNLDAGWDYDEIGLDKNVNLHCNDSRVQAVIAIVQSASFKLGSMLVEQF